MSIIAIFLPNKNAFEAASSHVLRSNANGVMILEVLSSSFNKEKEGLRPQCRLSLLVLKQFITALGEEMTLFPHLGKRRTTVYKLSYKNILLGWWTGNLVKIVVGWGEGRLSKGDGWLS